MIQTSIMRRRIPFFIFPSPHSARIFGFFQDDLRNPLKQGPSDSAPLPQGVFPSGKPWIGCIRYLCPIGQQLSNDKTSLGLSNLLPLGKTGVLPKSFSLTKAQFFAQEKHLCMIIAFLS